MTIKESGFASLSLVYLTHRHPVQPSFLLVLWSEIIRNVVSKGVLCQVRYVNSTLNIEAICLLFESITVKNSYQSAMVLGVCFSYVVLLDMFGPSRSSKVCNSDPAMC